MRKALADDTARLRELSLLVPAAQAVEFVTTDFDVHVVHGHKIGQRAYFVLRSQNYVRGADRVREAEFFQLGKTLAHAESAVAIHARAGNGFVEGNFRGPLRDGVVAFSAFVEANVH